MRPGDDPTSLGSILLAMGIISHEQLVKAVEEQDNSSIEIMLGKLLVANDIITSDQLEVALSAQMGLRSKKRESKARAQASIAEVGSARILELALSVRNKSEDNRQRRTGEGYPAINLTTTKKI